MNDCPYLVGRDAHWPLCKLFINAGLGTRHCYCESDDLHPSGEGCYHLEHARVEALTEELRLANEDAERLAGAVYRLGHEQPSMIANWQHDLAAHEARLAEGGEDGEPVQDGDGGLRVPGSDAVGGDGEEERA